MLDFAKPSDRLARDSQIFGNLSENPSQDIDLTCPDHDPHSFTGITADSRLRYDDFNHDGDHQRGKPQKQKPSVGAEGLSKEKG